MHRATLRCSGEKLRLSGSRSNPVRHRPRQPVTPVHNVTVHAKNENECPDGPVRVVFIALRRSVRFKARHPMHSAWPIGGYGGKRCFFNTERERDICLFNNKVFGDSQRQKFN